MPLQKIGESMGIGIRTFIFRDDGEIRRITYKDFHALWEGDSMIALPEFAGKRIRFAMVFVEMENRCPKKIAHVDYMRIGFDACGRFDQREMQKSRRDAVAMFPSYENEKDVVDEFRHLLAKLSYQDYKWKPTAKEVEKLRIIVMAG